MAEQRCPPSRSGSGSGAVGRDRATGRDRAVAPVVGKTLEIGVMLLFVGLLATGLFGTAVPEYRTGAGARVADRSLAATAHTIAAASDTPPALREGRLVRTIDLPATIRGANYRLLAADGAVVLAHPHPAIGGRRSLALDATVTVRGTIESSGPGRIVVRHAGNRTDVHLGGDTG